MYFLRDYTPKYGSRPHPAPVASAIVRYYLLLAYALTWTDYLLYWSWLMVFLPGLFSYWMRQPSRSRATQGKVDDLIDRILVPHDYLRFRGAGPVWHHAVVIVGAAIAAGWIRGGLPLSINASGWLAHFCYYHNSGNFRLGWLHLSDVWPYLHWEVFALAGLIQAVAFALFAGTPRCIEPWSPDWNKRDQRPKLPVRHMV